MSVGKGKNSGRWGCKNSAVEGAIVEVGTGNNSGHWEG